MAIEPAAFMSYVHTDDRYGHLTQFRERLSAEVQVQTGHEFPIFQDRQDILWGQNWKQRIEESLDAVTFLIHIITPSFFNSQPCRKEYERFVDREGKLNRNDLILPVYYVDSPLLNDAERRVTDDVAEEIAQRQYADWRDLRFEPFTNPQVSRTLAGLAVQVRDALERVSAAESKVVEKPRRRAATNPISRVDTQPDVTESGEEVHRPTAKTEPPMHVVDAMGRGQFLTIGEAVRKASPGDRILVRPGLYQEGLVMDKPLEIIGEGNLGDVVIQATGQRALLFKTTMGRVANMMLKQMGGGDWYGVDIAQGRLELEGCDITSQSLACVAIHAGADSRLRRNRIHDGNQSGVFVYDNGQGLLEDNEIVGNTHSGVQIKTGGNPTLRRNRIHDGKQSGVFVHNNGQGLLEDNEIVSNTGAGVAIRTGGNPTLRRNRINKNGHAAIWVHDKGGGVFEDNDLRDNVRGPWDISNNSKSKVKRARNLE